MAVNTPTELHPFERAGLGVAPFTYDGVTQNVFVAFQGDPGKPGGTCDYCGTGIMFEFHVRDRDGKKFKVGCDCAGKLARTDNERRDPVIAAIDRDRRKMERDKRHTRESAKRVEFDKWLAEHADQIAALPHPKQREGETLKDYADRSYNWSGHAGKMALWKYLKNRLGE